MAQSKRLLTVHEVLTVLEEDNTYDEATIYIEPPAVNELTDEDSGDEDDDDSSPSNLNVHQLSARATVTVLRGGLRPNLGGDIDSEEMVVEDTGTPAPPTKKRKVSLPRGTSSKKQPTVKNSWKKVDLSMKHQQRFKWTASPADITKLPQDPFELFQLFFDDEVIEMITEYTILYARSKGNDVFTTSDDEVRAFLGILVVSGYSPAPRRHLYWAQDDDVHNEAIASTMTRNRFNEMSKYLHVSDNAQLDVDDKLSKVRPLINMLNERFLTFFNFLKCQDLSIDESMVPYFGKHSCKQFIRGKPIRFGYKMWVLATPLGYCLQFEPYQGARGRQVQYQGVGMGGSVVLDLISELQPESDDSFHLTFDNLFSSVNLVEKLTDKNFACTGTIRANRIGDCPLQPVNEVKKSPRGSYDFKTNTTTGVALVRWNDNNVVNVISNAAGVNPVQAAKRWSRKDAKRISIGQPYMIKHYNKTMGGVDRLDQNVEKYRTSIRSKKWWWPIFNYCLDICINQTWHLHRLTQKDQRRSKTNDLLAVRRSIGRSLLAKGPRRLSLGRTPEPAALVNRVLPQIRFDRLDHLVEKSSTQLKCAACGMKTKHKCGKCKVGVHDRCFVNYHTR